MKETQTLLSAAARDLKTTTQALEEAVNPITAQYNDLAYKVERQAASLDTQGNNLARTADKIQKKNAELVAEGSEYELDLDGGPRLPDSPGRCFRRRHLGTTNSVQRDTVG